MSNVIRTRSQTYSRRMQSSQQLPSASRPSTPNPALDRTADILALQQDEYKSYHERCRQALAKYFNEDPDKNWNYIERLKRIWEAGNTPTSVLPGEMRVKLMNDPVINKRIRVLYDEYFMYPAQVTNNFETPRRSVVRPRVSFIPPVRSPPVSTSEQRVPVVTTSQIMSDRGVPRPRTRPVTSVASPSPFEASQNTLRSLVEPAEGEYRLNPPRISSDWQASERVESPTISHRLRMKEREDSMQMSSGTGVRTNVSTPVPPQLPTMALLTPSRRSAPPTPYVVHRSYEEPVSSFAYSEPGYGRRNNNIQSPLGNTGETIAEMFAQDPQISTQYQSLSSIEPSILANTTTQTRPSSMEAITSSVQFPITEEENSELSYAHSYELRQPPERMSSEEIESLIGDYSAADNTHRSRTNEMDSREVDRIVTESISDFNTLVDVDEEILASRPFLVRDPYQGDLDDSYADLYYDKDWKESSPHKYSFGKTPGVRKRIGIIGPYGIDPELDNEPIRLSDDTTMVEPITEMKTNMETTYEYGKPLETEKPRRRPSPVRDIPPHLDKNNPNTSRSHVRSSQWKHQDPRKRMFNPEASSTANFAWQRMMKETKDIPIPAVPVVPVVPLTQNAPPVIPIAPIQSTQNVPERSRRPYRWMNIPTTQSGQAQQASGAPPSEPPDSPKDDDFDPWNRRDRPSRHYGGGGHNPNQGRDNEDNFNHYRGYGGFGGGGGPPDDPGNNGYDDRESEDSDNFPHHNIWPPYGVFYRAKPPHPKAVPNMNPADFYGMPPYHYRAGWPRPQEYHHTRHLPEGEDKWVWQDRNGKSQQELNRESKLNLKLPSSFNGMDRRKWKSFLAECLVHFQAKPITYKEDSSKIAFAAALLEGPALTHYTTTLQQNSSDPFFYDWSIFVERMGAMFGLVNQRAQAQRKIHHMRMREDERFPNFLTKFQEEAFDCGFNETALKAALRYTLADRILTRLQYSPEPKEYTEFVNLLLSIDARYWEIRDSLEDRDRSRGTSRYYSGYYGANNSGNNANTNYYRSNFKKKSMNNRKFQKKEKAKGINTSDDELDEEFEDDIDDDDQDPYMEIDFYHDENPQPIDDSDELRTQFRRLYTGANDDIKEAIRRLSPQEKEERMRKGLCLYCGKPGHRIANCTMIQQKEKGRAIRSQEEHEIWSQDDGPLNWKAIQHEEQC